MAGQTYLTLQPSDCPQATLDNTLGFCRDVGAKLDVLVTGVAMPVLGYEGVPAGWVAFCDSLQARVDAMRATVEAQLVRREQPATVTAVYSDIGRFGATVERHALCSDGVILPDRAVLDSAVGRMAFHTTLFQCRRPLILLGAGAEQAPETVVVGWKNDVHSGAAVHHALPLLRQARSVVLTTVDPDGARDGPNPGRNMAAFLAHHGVAVSVENRPGGGADVADVLMECAADREADLIVAGAYGRSRLTDWLLGSSTRRLVEDCPVSVLLAH